MAGELVSPQTWDLSDLTLSNGRYYSDPANVPSGNGLQVENAIASASTLAESFPLSGTEMSATSYARMLAEGIPWEIGVDILGGVPPYNITDIDIPEWMSFEFTGYVSKVPPFGIALSAESPELGAFDVAFTVADQLGAELAVAYSGEVFAATDTTRFMFLNSTAPNNSGSGTRASPKRDVRACWGPTEATNTHANKIVYFDGGTYYINDDAFTDGVDIEFDGPDRITMSNAKPRTYVGIPGTGATIYLDGQSSNANEGRYLNFDTSSGLFLGHLTIGHPRSNNGAVRQIHIQTGSGFVDGQAHKVTFTGDSASPGTTNNCCVMLTDTIGTHSRMSFSQITMDGCQHQIGLQIYNVSQVTCTGWTVKNMGGNTPRVIHDKGGAIADVQVYGFLAIESNTGLEFRGSDWINDPVERLRLSTLWCNFKSDGTFWRTNGQVGDNWDDLVSARNNVNCTESIYDCGTGTMTFSHDVIQHSEADPIDDVGTGGASSTLVETDLATNTTGLLDASTNLLTGAARVTHLGDKGCEMVEAA